MSDSDRPADGADWVEEAAASFERWQKVRDMKALSRSAGILAGAAQRLIVDPLRAELAADIGEALLGVSVDQGRPDVLDYAINLLRRELEYIDRMLDPRGTALVAGCYAGLLTERFKIGGRLEDLAGALELYGQSAGFVEKMADFFDARARAWFWWGFGMAHWEKAVVAGQHAELVQAAECLGKAADATPAESAFGRQIRGNFALVQLELTEADHVGGRTTAEYRERLDRVIDTLRGLVETSPTELDRGKWLQNLAVSLRSRSGTWPEPDSRHRADLQEALAAIDRGLLARKVNESDKVHLLGTRAELRRILAGNRLEAGVEDAYAEAVEVARRTVHPELVPLASDWQHLLTDADRWADAATAGDAALSALQALVDRQPHQHYKHVYLRKAAGLAESTAVARVRAGDASGAVSTLEQALAVVWRQRYVGPRRVATRLIEAGARDLAERYLSLVADARAIDASDQALRTAEGQLAELRPVLEEVLGEGSLAIEGGSAPERLPGSVSLHLACSRTESVALIRNEQGHVSAIPLPGAPPSEVYRIAERFRIDVVSEDSEGESAHAKSSDVVTWLEEAVLRPIEAPIIELLRAGTEQTLTIVTTGPFTGLPLHAARLRDGRPAAALGLSYVPALSALDVQRIRFGPRTRVLIVADPTRQTEAALHGAHQERQALSTTWPHAVALSGAAATVSAIRRAMSTASIVHFACHGRSEDTEPLRSAVLLADGELTMRDVLSARLKPGCLVVLSACQTAVHDRSVPGEAMSLAAGFLAAGAAAVVASLWPVPDQATAALMGAFHEALRAGSSTPHALGAAQSTMAAGLLDSPDGEDWRTPYFWAGFIALGGAVAARRQGGRTRVTLRAESDRAHRVAADRS